eukprot:5755359-Pyramimonas_sp.AAC.1
MRSYAHIAKRTLGNTGGIFCRGHRAETIRAENSAGQPATDVWKGDPQPTGTAALLAQNGGPATGSQDSWARYQGPSATAAPAQATAPIGSAV